MAKLSARGRTELARVSKETTFPDSRPCTGCNATGVYPSDLRLSDNSLLQKMGDVCKSCSGKKEEQSPISWERNTYALMSDGNILSKRDVLFAVSELLSNRKHTYNWTVLKKTDMSADKFLAVMTAKGYKQEKK